MSNNNIFKSMAFAALFVGGVAMQTACTAGFEEENRPGQKISQEELDRDNYATSSFLTQLVNEAFPEQENTYQMTEDLIGNYLGRFMTYANNGFSDKNFARFNAPNGWVSWPFNNSLPKATSAFNSIVEKTNRKGVFYAQALVLRAQVYQRYVDMYGALPVGLEADAAAYSSQENVYKLLIANLDTAATLLKPNLETTLNEEFDKVYAGQLGKWYKLANSLKLRLAIRMRYADPAAAKKAGEEAVAAGVITSNEDNCAVTYVPNGQYKTSVEWGDSRACADLECFLTGYSDPRLSAYFKPAKQFTTRTIIGCLAGAKIENKTIADKLYSEAKVDKNTRGVWLTAAEMAFCRAEGALAGWSGMGGTVEDLYNRAISLSFEQWGLGSASSYLSNNTNTQANYTDADGGYGQNVAAVSSITIKWDDTATDEKKLERLITQKWIALFPDGQEAWSEIRRTGYPKVFPVAQSTSGYNLDVPNRIPFANDELTKNPVNYRKAVQLIGGTDDYATKMWWQKK
ncbi:MAG: SusD/RagB family nutrient-binding outer membrane lipoprotein [Hoylesella shahii]|uniref:SusD/RagB family nutrient-binding outer membrane lipoprotein n=1 Tax=Hoylesella shahii TaxID=228603 RepID=UPI003F9FBF19